MTFLKQQKSSIEKDKAFILDVLIFAQGILEFTSEMDKEMFANDLKTQTAVLSDWEQ